MASSNSCISRIFSPDIPKPRAPYSQAVVANQTVYVSGLVGLDPKSEKLADGGIEGETNQALINLGHVLTAAGTDYGNVVKVTILLKDIKDWPTVNNIYAKYFIPDRLPARCAYEVSNLPLQAKIEIEATALTGKVVEVPQLQREMK
ncbi:hypothetical protein HELRODRAFT_170631 [Helobdella robusta]|uniref:Uncharacterized protein n=1 Tax=Helobdella robusta TaxID=6412 RepID=T1F395_HELRO|nr:hypothetical protein HELRODRAFT_170631 [Helobdella robusta]ESO07303.1 hypothetical protein HELRODRAFT_170631 [Helobdella robusta]